MDDVMDRRRFLQASIATGVVASSAPVLGLAGTMAVPRDAAPDSNEMFRWSEATIADLQPPWPRARLRLWSSRAHISHGSKPSTGAALGTTRSSK